MPAFLMLLIQGLMGGLMISLPTLIKRLAISLGVGVFSVIGLEVVLNHIKSLAFSNLAGMPALTANVIGILNIDTAFSIVMSAYAMKLSFKALGGLHPKQLGLF